MNSRAWTPDLDVAFLEGQIQGGFSCIYDSLNSFICLHFELISDLLFKYDASPRAITTFSVKQRSQ